MNLDIQEDLAHTANVLREHYHRLVIGTCLCGAAVGGLHGWSLHVAEVLQRET